MPRDAPATRFLNRPMALLPSWRPAVLYPDDATSSPGPGPATDLVGQIAVIAVRGILVHGAYGSGWGETTYGSIRKALAAALADTSVAGIALHIDSPGGEVAGCADLADAIAAARGDKPLHAICDEMACSAAYWLASACDRVTVPRTGVVGSIGVVAFHADITRALDGAGVTVTTLTYGSRKAELAPTTKLTRGARDRAQADVDTMGELFVSAVARNRRLRAQAVRDTEAGTFLGRDAVRAGLADTVASAEDAFLALMDAAADRRSPRSSARRAGPTGATRASTRTSPTMSTSTRSRPSALTPQSFAHLRRSTYAEERAANAEPIKRDPTALARRILTLHAQACGEEPPKHVWEGPPQPKRVKVDPSAILAAYRKRTGDV